MALLRLSSLYRASFGNASASDWKFFAPRFSSLATRVRKTSIDLPMENIFAMGLLKTKGNIRFCHPNNNSLIITIIIVSVILYQEIWNMTLLQRRSNSSNIFYNSEFIFNLKPTLRSCTRCSRELKETEFFSIGSTLLKHSVVTLCKWWFRGLEAKLLSPKVFWKSHQWIINDLPEGMKHLQTTNYHIFFYLLFILSFEFSILFARKYKYCT